ncbi:MAG: thioredoxin family protein [Candidatus Rifleibacteriota bacterium]
MKKLLTLVFLFAFSMTLLAQIASSSAETSKKLPRMVDFGSKQCKACKAMEAVLEACIEKHSDKFKTEFIDVWLQENQALAQANQIQTIPTQIFFNEEDKELFRNTGFLSEDEILAKWKELGFVFETGSSSDIPAANQDKQTESIEQE